MRSSPDQSAFDEAFDGEAAGDVAVEDLAE